MSPCRFSQLRHGGVTGCDGSVAVQQLGLCSERVQGTPPIKMGATTRTVVGLPACSVARGSRWCSRWQRLLWRGLGSTAIVTLHCEAQALAPPVTELLWFTLNCLSETEVSFHTRSTRAWREPMLRTRAAYTFCLFIKHSDSHSRRPTARAGEAHVAEADTLHVAHACSHGHARRTLDRRLGRRRHGRAQPLHVECS